ncbi:NaeI family type II restriction endonuclease [Streptomyces sp. NPDC051172]|uniref:NaeI family type II restriction endonuclease n=1 Tax=Streptomyces sp. NPDC051172 TaxID=3155796 RepID=UPI003429005A
MSAAENEVATLLRDVADQAGLTLRDIAQRLTPEMLGGRPVPGVATLSKRFAGEGLDINGVFVEAVLRLCAPDTAAANALCERATALLSRASEARRRQRASHDQPISQKDAAREIARLRRRVAEQQEALEDEQRSRRQAEAITSMLLGLLTRQPVPAYPVPSGVDARLEGGAAIGLGQRMATLEAQLAQLHDDLLRHRPPASAEHPPSRSSPLAQSGADVPLATPAGTPFPAPEEDGPLRLAHSGLLSLDPGGFRIARAVRAAFDDVLDGPRTGRYRIAELQKPEKTYLGPLVERSFVNTLALPRVDSDDTANLLLPHDIKAAFNFSVTFGGWLFSPEHIGQLVLLLHADDETNRWSLGVIRLRDDFLTQGGNRDTKRRLTPEHRREILWLHRDASLPANGLAELPTADMQEILKQRPGTRVTALLRAAQGLLLSTNNVETVSMGDPGRRVREARDHLAAEGIIVLSGKLAAHQRLARQLGLPVPAPHEYITARLAPLNPDESTTPHRKSIDIGNHERWALALPHDPIHPLPALFYRNRILAGSVHPMGLQRFS